MNAELLRVADAVVDALNAAALDPEFQAQRLYQPQFELPELNVLRVSVVPKDQTTQTLTRGITRRIFRVDVGVQKKFERGDAPELDPLVTLVERIAALFHRRRLPGLSEAFCTAAKPEPVYAPEHMDQFRQFTSVLTLTFQMLE